MKMRPPILRAWTGKKIKVDLYAGGGGASEGSRRATGRSPDIAVNHWPAAIAMHKVNHPDCAHYCEDVYKVNPRLVVGDDEVEMLWASPTCIYFSRAKGKRLSPATAKIRGLAWSIIPWIKLVRPGVILLENVPEFLAWGPICRVHSDGCAGELDDSGDTCEKRCPYGRPIRSRAGETFRAFERRVRSFGYSFEVKKIKAWEYGAPTTRERVYIIMRADGLPAEFPAPTHAPPDLAVHSGLLPWRTAAEIIDWSIACPSIFDRKKPHKPATRRRLAKGMRKFVLEAQRPFLIHLTHGDRHAPHSITEPVPTITGANRGEQSVVVPYMVHRSNGERPGQEPRVYDVLAPHPTVVAGGLKTSPVLAFLAKNYSERRPTETLASSMDTPIGTTTGRDHHSLVAAHTITFYGTSTGASLEKPIGAVTAQGEHHGVVAASIMRYNGERRPGEGVRGGVLDEPVSTLDASNRLAISASFLSRYNGQSVGQHPSSPIGTIDAKDRYALVESQAAEWSDIIAAKARRVYDFLISEGHEGPWMDAENRIVRIPGTNLVIYDIGMRMLVARELFRANGFTDDYVIDLIGPRGKPLTKTEQVRMAGNVVCPDVAEKLIRAGLGKPGKPRARRGEQMTLALNAA